MLPQDGPWNRYRQTSAPPAVIEGPPKQIDPAEAERLDMSRRDQARQDALAPMQIEAAKLDVQKKQRELQGAVGKPMRQGDANALDEQVSAYSYLKNAVGSFQDDYAGNTLTGELENWAQGKFGTGTPGQRDWWANFRTADNLIRNQLFGASLTAGEKEAYNATTISPGMSPAEVKKNLQRRVEIARSALSRRVGRLRAAGFNPEEIDAATGEFSTDFSPDYKPGQGAEGTGGLTIAFNDEARPATGYRLNAEQEGQIAQAIRDGDEGQALALLQRFSGNAPTAETIESVRKGIRNAKTNPNASLNFNYGAVDKAAQSKEDRERFGDYLPQAMSERKDLIADPIVRGIADVVPFSDEIAAAGNTLLGGGTYADNVRRERAIDEADARVNGNLRLGGQLGGAALPIGRFLGFGRTGAARSALNYGAEGAALGGLYAAGKADPAPEKTLGQALQERAAAAPVGAALGGATAYGLAALGNAIRNRPTDSGPPPGGEDAVDIAQSAADESIPISRPIVDPSRRDAMAYLESSIAGSGTVRRSLDATAQGIEARAGELGRGGTTQESGVMGERIQEAGARYVDRSRNIGRRLYDRAAQMAGNSTVQPREAVRVIDEQIADLSRNANQNSPLIKYLQEVRGDLVDEAGNIRAKAVGDIRDIRTNLRGNINTRNLTATDAERRVGMVLDAARQDIQRDLAQTAPAAVRQYARADKFWRERQSEIKQVVQRVIGPDDNRLGGEQVWQRIRTMASDRGDSQRLERIWSKLEPEEQADAAATIASTLGRRSAEDEFSPALFVNSVRGLSPAARRTIFGPEGAKSIANLRRVAEAYRDTASRLNNSRSGVVINWGNELKGLVTRGGIGGIAGTAVAGPVGGTVGAAVGAGTGQLARYLGARALMNPDMTRWLANAPRQTSPSAIRKYVNEGLSNVARRNPAVAQDALGLQRYLQQAIRQSPTRAAASEQEKQ